SAYMSLGQIYYQAGKTDQAAKEYEAVLEMNPKMVSAHMLLGIMHENRKEYDKAQSHYEATLKLAPWFAPAANNLAWLMAERGGNLDVALSHAQTAREAKPDDPHRRYAGMDLLQKKCLPPRRESSQRSGRETP